MSTTQAPIVDPQQAYPPTAVVIDRPTDDLADFIAACERMRSCHRDDLDAQLQRATTRLAAQHDRHGQLSSAALHEAARWQVVFEQRRLADQELRGMQPTAQLVQDAGAHDDAELYRRREQALRVLLSDEAVSYVRLVPQVLADRERACRQQALLVDDQTQLTSQLTRLRGARGWLIPGRVRRLNAELAELDRRLTQVQAEIARQQALLDAIHAADRNRQAWLDEHQDELLQGAAAVLVLTRRLLALANPPGCTRPVLEVDLDHPMGRDPLAPPATNGGPLAPNGADARVTPAAAARAAAPGPAQPPGQG
jgi:hypothetical protein